MVVSKRHYSAGNTSSIGAFSVPSRPPCIESCPGVATNDVAEAGESGCWTPRYWRWVLQVLAKSRSKHECRRHHTVPAAVALVGHQAGERPAAVRASATPDTTAAKPPGSLRATARHPYDVARRKSRDHFLGCGKHSILAAPAKSPRGTPNTAQCRRRKKAAVNKRAESGSPYFCRGHMGF